MTLCRKNFSCDGVSIYNLLGCSSNKKRSIAIGPDRLVMAQNADIRPGEILVAARTDPGWIVLFALVSGLIVEHGSLLSHASIVSREMGLPAVVSLPNATSWLRSGDWIELNGSTGEVTRLAVPENETDETTTPS